MFQWYMFKFEIFKLFSKNKIYDINNILIIIQVDIFRVMITISQDHETWDRRQVRNEIPPLDTECGKMLSWGCVCHSRTQKPPRPLEHHPMKGPEYISRESRDLYVTLQFFNIQRQFQYWEKKKKSTEGAQQNMCLSFGPRLTRS